MTSLYQQTVPPIVKSLKNLSGVLEKGVKFADEKGMKHDEMLNFRLAPDMRGLSYQIQSCCNTAKFIPVRLGIMDDIYFKDDETTFDELQTRITRTIELLRSLDQNRWAGKETESLIMTTKVASFKFDSGQEYVSNFALPNFHFHFCTAYCILRHLGVQIGALDYLGKDTFVTV